MRVGPLRLWLVLPGLLAPRALRAPGLRLMASRRVVQQPVSSP